MGEHIDWKGKMRAFSGAGAGNVLFLEVCGVTEVCLICVIY